jgi:rod shape-determining protein MreB
LIKIKIGNAYKGEKIERMLVKGRDLLSGIPKIIGINSAEIRGDISSQVEEIFETVKTGLEKTPPELAADIVEKGIVLTGGGALLKDLDKLLHEKTGLPIILADDPLSCVVKGSEKVLDSIDVFRQVMM